MQDKSIYGGSIMTVGHEASFGEPQAIFFRSARLTITEVNVACSIYLREGARIALRGWVCFILHKEKLLNASYGFCCQYKPPWSCRRCGNFLYGVPSSLVSCRLGLFVECHRLSRFRLGIPFLPAI